MTAEMIDVFLVDDHQLCQKGLCELLTHSGHFNVLGSTGNPLQALERIRELRPELVVMDLKMPGMDGVALLKSVQTELGAIPSVILTMSDGQEDLANVLRAGGRGYLLKDMEPSDIVESLRRVAKGELVVAPGMSGKLSYILQHGNHGDDVRSKSGRLTEREREILGFIASGSSNKAIAKVLNISHDTVKLHVRHILSKLNLSSRVQAAVFAVENRNSSDISPPAGR